MVSYPRTRSLDENGRIQIDGDAGGHGGVRPDLEVPHTRENVMREARGEDVELETAAALLAKNASSPRD